MKKLIFTLICSFFLMSAFSQNDNNYAKDQLIIKFKSIDSLEFKRIIRLKVFGHKVLDSLNKKFFVIGIRRTGNRRKSDSFILKFKDNQQIDSLIEKYMNTNLFKYVEPNFIGHRSGRQSAIQNIPSDTHFSKQWGLYNDGSFSLSSSVKGADTDMTLAWDIEQGSSSTIVAVLDCGVKLDHPEFNGRIWENPNETNNSEDDDNNGYEDDIHGWDFAYDNNDPTDNDGHGTNVAGIIGANGNNNSGYAGVDWNCQLMICKVIDEDGAGYYSWWADAIYYAVDNGANLINMSVGGISFSNLLLDAIDYAYFENVTIIACMMNENNNDIFYPAGYQNTIAVGSTDSDDNRSNPFFWSESSGSNYGEHIDVVAPGNYIYSLSHKSNNYSNSYWGGTSQATPLVTGLSALLIAQDPTRSPDDIRNILTVTAEDQTGSPEEDTEGYDIYHGHGRINAYQALLSNTLSNSTTNLEGEEFLVYNDTSSESILVDNSTDSEDIIITEVAGSEVNHATPVNNTDKLIIDVSNLPAGNYFIHITNEKGITVVSEKLIVD